jgi:hypothetical protein
MGTSRFVRVASPLMLASFLWAACGGAGFEPASKIQGLRVLALQKEPAYPHPGETVDLKLLYWDGKTSESSPRKIQFNFFQCDNPPGDFYYGCFSDKLMPLMEAPPPMPEAGVDAGSTADASDEAADATDVDAIDTDATTDTDAMTGTDAGAASDDARIVTKRIVIPPREDIVLTKVPIDYGLRYVFFTACAGHIGFDSSGGPNTFPVACFDDTNQKLGPDDFVPGYSSIYVYDTLRNANPVVAPELEIPGVAPGPDGLRHIPHCTQSDRSQCPAYDINAAVDIAQSAEIDPEAMDGTGNLLKEQVWVAYYSTDGDFTNSLRLVNDAASGPNPDHGTQYRAPITPGTVHLFGVVHDNRGGVAWALGKFVID